MAARWLSERGLVGLERNVTVTGGEIDLIMSDRGRRVAVEVRSVTSEGDPIDAVDHRKRAHVARIAAAAGVSRVDLVGVGFRPWGVEIHWVPG
ncbi:MAG TPA: YraN family protein [Acidimicrobiia bacterium]|nr:YraN family protein [Acidimicrobiia bacterium]